MRRFALPLLLIAGAAALAALGTVMLVFPVTASAQAAARTALPTRCVAMGPRVGRARHRAASSIARGYAVAKVGAAAVGVLAEKPDLLGRLLIFVGLAEGIAIYGVIIAILILNRRPELHRRSSGAFAYVGDAVTATGFRLAGVAVVGARPRRELAAVFPCRAGDAEAVIITVAVAEPLPRAELDAALAGDRPVVVLITDSAGASPLEPAERVRAQLGLESLSRTPHDHPRRSHEDAADPGRTVPSATAGRTDRAGTCGSARDDPHRAGRIASSRPHCHRRGAQRYAAEAGAVEAALATDRRLACAPRGAPARRRVAPMRERLVERWANAATRAQWIASRP